MRLRTYQRDDAAWVRETPRCLIAHEQGVGKTPIAAMGITTTPALIVCPAAVCQHWERSILDWRPDLDDVRVISYDLLHRRKIRRPRCLIVDECHYVKNPEAIRTRYVKELARTAQQVIFMSGTPVPNRPIEFWPVLDSIGCLDGMSWHSYANRFCAAWYDDWGTFNVSGHSNLDLLRAIVKPYMRRRVKEDVLTELPPKQFRVIPIKAPSALRAERDIPEIKDLDVSSLRPLLYSIPQEALSTIMRLHGEAKVKPASAYIIDLLSSGVEKLVVGAWHRDVIQDITDRIRSAGYVVASYESGASSEKRQGAIDRFQDGDAHVIIGNLKSMGTGITLTAAHHQVLVESNWSPGDLYQWSDRCHRIGQTKSVTIDVLTVHESIDEHVLRRILQKKEVTEQCLPVDVAP